MITSIIEDADWSAANDPCSSELGGGWRIPTSTEWNNVAVGGGWTTWSGPWNSGLKLHAAGYLDHFTGLRYNVGIYGIYWSCTQNNNGFSWYLGFDNGSSGMSYDHKATGYSVRCIRNI